MVNVLIHSLITSFRIFLCICFITPCGYITSKHIFVPGANLQCVEKDFKDDVCIEENSSLQCTLLNFTEKDFVGGAQNFDVKGNFVGMRPVKEKYICDVSATKPSAFPDRTCNHNAKSILYFMPTDFALTISLITSFCAVAYLEIYYAVLCLTFQCVHNWSTEMLNYICRGERQVERLLPDHSGFHIGARNLNERVFEAPCAPTTTPHNFNRFYDVAELLIDPDEDDSHQHIPAYLEGEYPFFRRRPEY